MPKFKLRKNEEELHSQDRTLFVGICDRQSDGQMGALGKAMCLLILMGGDIIIKMFLKGYPLEAKIVSEYDQEIPQSQTADNPMVPRGRAA